MAAAEEFKGGEQLPQGARDALAHSASEAGMNQVMDGAGYLDMRMSSTASSTGVGAAMNYGR